MNKNRILIFIIIVIIIIIIITLCILNLNKSNTTNELQNDIIQEQNYVDDVVLQEQKSSISLLEDTRTFYTMQDCINKYLNYSATDDEKSISKIQLNINNSNTKLKIDNEKEAIVQKIWTINKNNVSIGYAETKIRNKNSMDISNEQSFYFIVSLDTNNGTYGVCPISTKYSESDKNNIINYNINNIEKNDINEYADIAITNQEIINIYFDEYKKRALFKPEEAYNLLDEEYKKEKYDTFAKYKEYLDKNKEKIENSLIEKYSVENHDDYTQYTLVDNYDNTYIIKEKSVMNFTIELDDYTTNLSKIDESYNQATDEEKIKTNMDLLIKMINNKDYEQIYDKYLNSSFKNKYFATKTSFSQYMSKNFFDYNYVDSETYVKEDNYFVISIHYKSREGLSAEENNKKIIMKLGESINDFQISFMME